MIWFLLKNVLNLLFPERWCHVTRPLGRITQLNSKCLAKEILETQPSTLSAHESLSSTCPWWLTFMGRNRRILFSYFSGNKSGTCYRACLLPQTICDSWLWHPQLLENENSMAFAVFLHLQRTLLPSSGSGDHGSVPLQRLGVTCMFLSSVPLSRLLWVLPTLVGGGISHRWKPHHL